MTDGMLFGFIPVYGLLIACAIALAVFICGRDEKALNLPKDTAVDMALYAVPAAVIGARLYYVAFEWKEYAANPIRILYIWEGGLAIYGGVLGGLAGLYLLSKRHVIPYLTLLDLAAPAVLLGQAIGRWGNFINQEAYGYLIDNPALQFFPLAVYVRGEWHMATFFYESLLNLIGFALMYYHRKRACHKGDIFLWYLCWYGASRMGVEGLRTDSLMFLTLRVSQWLSLFMVLAAAIFFLVRSGRKIWFLLPLAAIGVMAAYLFTDLRWLPFLAGAMAVCGCYLLYKTPAPMLGADAGEQESER